MGKKKTEDPAVLDAELDAETAKDIADLERTAFLDSIPGAFGGAPVTDQDRPPEDDEPTADLTPAPAPLGGRVGSSAPNSLTEAFPPSIMGIDRGKLAIILGHLRELEVRLRQGSDVNVLPLVRELIRIAEA